MSIEKYETVIGLEIHAELNTKTKIFCSCRNSFGAEPNENTCPVCLGLPGALPVLNEKVVEKATKAGMTLNCEINKNNIFDRKNYFYPDLPKAYQISQLYEPICRNGFLEVTGKKFRIHEIHMEEDAGKLVHDGEFSLIDYNRCGVPLIEIVTEPDFSDEDEVKSFLDKVREILSFADISDAKMEEGSLRVDVNLSVRKAGEILGTRTETKNLNSIKAVQRSIKFERNRQVERLERGEKIIQETRKWDDEKEIGYSMRSKEDAMDYRYFPDPDLLENVLSNEYLKELKTKIPILPDDRRKKYKMIGIGDEIISILSANKRVSDFFDEMIKKTNDKKEIKEIANLISSEVMRLWNEKGENKEPYFLNKDTDFAKEVFAITKLIIMGKINRLKAKEVLEVSYFSGENISEIAREKNYIIEVDEKKLNEIIKELIKNNANAVREYQEGNKKTLGFLVGQGMKEMKGAVQPALLKEKIIRQLAKLSEIKSVSIKKTEEKNKGEEINKDQAKKNRYLHENISEKKTVKKSNITVNKKLSLTRKYRTYTCNEISEVDINKKVKLSGWVHRVRDHGGIIFADLRDQFGITQIVITEELAEKLNRETVVFFEGKVVKRDEETLNPKIKTGMVEVLAEKMEILGQAKRTLPFLPDESLTVNEEVRLKYRYLDLRNNKVLSNMLLRTEIIKTIRANMDALNFTEIQTPILANSSPEGARDYLIPSRLHKGKFYALPQAPQQFKQLLMVAGFDRYYQIAPCFRDEDARKDRSPGEFYQLDFEMAFATEEDVFKIAETVLSNTFKTFTNKEITNTPFPIFSYKDVILKYGTDKPDLRNPLEIINLTDFFREVDFKPFKNSPVRGIVVPNAAKKPRSFFRDMEKFAFSIGMKGLGYITVLEDGSYKGPIDKFMNSDQKLKIKKITSLKKDDVLYFISAKEADVSIFAGKILTEVAKRMDIIDRDKFAFCFINDFPMYEKNEESGEIDFLHNPFSMPKGEMESLLNKNPLEIIAEQYDIVCNGVELSSGAVRNHKPEVMKKAFELAGYSEDILKEKFSALYEAFSYGAPPHAGMAPGIDRIVMLLSGEENIREIIPFPLNQNAVNPMLCCPSEVSEKQLREIHIKIRS
jgi:aspartyl-tRNA synthetase